MRLHILKEQVTQAALPYELSILIIYDQHALLKKLQDGQQNKVNKIV
jgi:hypothetical protein